MGGGDTGDHGEHASFMHTEQGAGSEPTTLEVPVHAMKKLAY